VIVIVIAIVGQTRELVATPSQFARFIPFCLPRFWPIR
jgi:hypothetical protein